MLTLTYCALPSRVHHRWLRWNNNVINPDKLNWNWNVTTQTHMCAVMDILNIAIHSNCRELIWLVFFTSSLLLVSLSFEAHPATCLCQVNNVFVSQLHSLLFCVFVFHRKCPNALKNNRWRRLLCNSVCPIFFPSSLGSSLSLSKNNNNSIHKSICIFIKLYSFKMTKHFIINWNNILMTKHSFLVIMGCDWPQHTGI